MKNVYGIRKEEVTFMYDMLKQIDLVSRGCLCHECDGEGKVDIPMWDWQRDVIENRKKELFDKIYKGDVLTDLYRNRIREEQCKNEIHQIRYKIGKI